MKIAVLMSGGVDSSVAAILLREQGYEVWGITMINWNVDIGHTARAVADYIGIEHKIIDMKKEFDDRVINYFCSTYEKGHTPNPCVACNKAIKFGALLDYALNNGADMIATGHYIRREFKAGKNRYLLKKALDTSKDQSYFLYGLTQKQLAHSIFPLGDLKKTEVRELAEKNNLPVAKSKDSQEICFIEKDYRDFILERVDYQPGQVIDTAGNVLGKHKGLPFYTIGQRRGLGISAGKPVYVIDLDMETNQLVLGGPEELMRGSLFTRENNFIHIPELEEAMEVEVKIRYKANPAQARIYPQGDLVKVEFTEPQRAITRGQSAVFYLGDYLLGGGIIV
ncbi:MAG TPA: tRNA 2-thiouridine(34) synthase MnmA [Syntrophomonadaceae bacterium]|nr:tRNA 2-thiouridine(34) synthase MnmA [Syntrophomonadaceae bacterium]